MLDTITAEQFAACGDEPFRAQHGDEEVAFELIEATALASAGSPRPSPPFRVLLRAQAGFNGGQGIYRVQHPTLGEMDLFLVPIAREEGRVRYEAIFN